MFIVVDIRWSSKPELPWEIDFVQMLEISGRVANAQVIA